MSFSGPIPEAVVELVAQRFRVLAEPARIRLLDALRPGPASVGHLALQLDLGQQNTSKHLGVLANAGLVQRTRVGNNAVYAITDPTVFTLCEVVCDSLRERYTALRALLPAEVLGSDRSDRSGSGSGSGGS